MQDKGGLLANPLILPVLSPVPLETLLLPIDTLLDRLSAEKRHPRKKITLIGNFCRKNGFNSVWTLAINSRKRLLECDGCGALIADLAEEALALVECHLDMFPQLRAATEFCAAEVRKTSNQDWPSDIEVRMAIAGTDDRVKDRRFVATLARYGLRSRMSPDELFCFDLKRVKKGTPAGEIARFAALKVGEVQTDPRPFGLDSDAHVVEILFYLATAKDPMSPAMVRARNDLLASVKWNFNRDVLRQMGISILVD